ncbi:serine/threonine-protein kinase [Streptomyces sp. F001]|uniref:serine/threonine-protein kinase n=1 Tax=Streptomyces sp. F001 TaxID=1510026 RepID=UPI0023EA6F05|nr:serine/threonine-protein kinase [Streptomyces sp. F001]
MVTGRYRLVESIGQGGMGRVWRAADDMLDRPVAVKEMRIDGLDAEDARTRRERTLREARATARIDHPNVVRVYDVVDEGERLWIVMELVDGRSLERIMAEDGPLGPRETARTGLGLVEALRQVHARGVLHRDIKPGNVLVEHDARRIVLTDFGIAAIQDAKALTMVGMLVGSPDYMAPERVSGRPQGPPSDVWSLGATLCAALAGRSPFSRDTTLATLHAVLYEEPELPAAAGTLRDILAALLQKEPSARPALEELETALRPVAFPEPTPTVMGPGAVPGPVPLPEPTPPGTGAVQERVPLPEPQPAANPVPEPAPVAHPVPEPVAHPAPQPVANPVPEPPEPAQEQPTPLLVQPPHLRPPPEGPRPAGVSLLRAEAVTERRPAAIPPGSELPGPAVPSAPPRRTRRRTTLVAATGVLTAAAVAGIVLAATAESPDDTRTDTKPPASSAYSSSPTVEGTSRPPTLPPGAREEAGGFAWTTPEGWRRDVKTGAEVHYTSPDGTQELVAKSSLARGDLMDSWRTSERGAHQGQDYRKIRLEETTFRGHPAVVWEYTFRLEGVPWHARLLGFDAKGKSYQINTWYQPTGEEKALAIYEDVKKSFTLL